MRQNETIDLAELRRLSDRLFARLERGGIERVSVQNRHYWTIFADEAFSLDKPPELVLGDVLDDLRKLRSKESRARDDENIVFWHAFHRLSGLMLLLARADMQGELAAAPAKET
jgi:hypothetical protein